MQLPDVLSNHTIVNHRTVAETVRETKTVISFSNGSHRSLQSLVFPIEFVDENKFLGRLHQFCVRQKLEIAALSESHYSAESFFSLAVKFFSQDRALRS